MASTLGPASGSHPAGAGSDAAALPASVMQGRSLGVTTQTDAGNRLHVSYARAEGTARTLLGRSATQSRLRWYGAWTGHGPKLRERITKYIANVQAGDPEVVVPMATFRVKAGGGNKRRLTREDRTSYRSWYATLARAIGDTPTVVVVEPDLPMVLKRHGGKSTTGRLNLVAWAVNRLESLPRTDVYIDTGSADWLSVRESVSLLKRAGVDHSRGFALGATHYDSTAANIRYARELALALDEAGIPGKKSVIDTADNGRAFTHAEYRHLLAAGERTNHYDNADVCINLTQTHCNTLGIPPTTDVANPKWDHSSTENNWARTYVDAYLWFGRPWLRMQADPYCRARAVQVGRTTPWAEPLRQVSAATVRRQQATCFAKP